MSLTRKTAFAVFVHMKAKHEENQARAGVPWAMFTSDQLQPDVLETDKFELGHTQPAAAASFRASSQSSSASISYNTMFADTLM